MTTLFDAIWTRIQSNLTWLKNNKADSTHTHSQYLTSHQDISGKQDKSNIVTAWGQTPSDSKYPSEKLVYDTIGDIESALHTINSGVSS